MVNFGYSNNFGTGAFNSRFKNPYNFSAGRVDSDTSSAIFDAIKRRQQMELEMSNERSLLDRTFDTLLLPNYVIAGSVDGMFSKDKTVWEGFSGGFKAGNPFGDGYDSGETTFSDVLETMGWKPESGLGKFAKGATGFAFDVLLDPTTYLTGGLSAVVRGSGRTGSAIKSLDQLASVLPESMTGGKKITHMTPEMAEYVIKGSKNAPTDTAQLAKDSESLAKKYNKLIGIRDADGGKPITFGLANLPFAEKLASKPGVLGRVTLSDGNSTRAFADNIGTAYGYSKVRDAFYGSKMGKLLSSNAPLKQLAETKPEALYDYIRFVDITKGKKIGKIEKDKLIREKGKMLMGLTHAQNAEILKLLEDPSTFAPLKGELKFAETAKGQDLAKLIESTKNEKQKALSDAEQIKNLLFGLEKNKDMSSAEREVLDTLKKQLGGKVAKSDVKHVESMKERAIRIKDLETKKATLESTPKTKVVEETVTREVDATPKVEQLKSLWNDATNERQSWQGEREMGSIMRKAGVDDRALRENGTKVESERLLRDEMSKFVYGGKKQLSPGFRVTNMKGIIDLAENATDTKKLFDMLASGKSFFGMMNAKGANDVLKRIEAKGVQEVVRDYIERNPQLFSEHAESVWRYLGKKHGYSKFDEEIRQPMNKLIEKGKLTGEEKKRLQHLKGIDNKRKADFQKYFHESTYDDYIKMIRDEEGSERYEMFYKMLLEPEETARRNRFIQEDSADVGRKSGEFDEKVSVAGQTSRLERDAMKEQVHLEWANEVKRITMKNPEYKAPKNASEHIYLREKNLELALKEIFPTKLYSELSEGQRGFLMGTAKQMAREEMANPKNAPETLKKIKAVALKKMMKDIEIDRTLEVSKSATVGKMVHFKQGDEVVEGTVTGKIQNKVETHRSETETVMEKVTYVDSKGVQRTRNKPVHKVNKIPQFEHDGTYSLNVKLADGKEVTVAMSDVTRVRNASDAPFREVAKETEVITRSVEHIVDVTDEVNAIAKEIKREKKNMANAKSRYTKKRRDMVDELNARASTHLSKIEQLESSSKGAEEMLEQMTSKLTTDPNIDVADLDNIVETIAKEIEEIEEALLVDDALVAYVERTMGDDVVKNALWEANVRDTKLINLSERASSKQIEEEVLAIREALMNAGAKEVEMRKLDKDAFKAYMEHYVPHIPTEEGRRHFNSMKDIKEHGTSVTQDFGYGQIWNPYSKSRTIEGKNIEAINKFFSENEGVAKVFNDNIGEIYIDRMLKHNDLAYDDEYMRTMMDKFGYDIEGTVKRGYKAVANYGLVKETMHEMARLKLKSNMSAKASAHYSDAYKDLYQEAKTILMGELKKERAEFYKNQRFFGTKENPTNLSGEEFNSRVKQIMDSLPQPQKMAEYSDADMARFYDEAIDETLDEMRLTRDSLDAHAMPMIELTTEQMVALKPLGLAKQVSEVIVDKANSTRMLAMAKDESRALQLYDKFLHFMKLNQTVIMPAFHIRNDMSNTFQNWLGVGRDAFSVRFQRDALKASMAIGNIEKLKKIPPIVTDDASRVYHWDEIVDLALKHGGIDEGYFAQDIGAGALTSGLFKNKIKPSWNPTDTANFKPYQIGTKIGSTAENKGRLIHIASLLKQGKTIEEAVESSTKYLFDYSDLTMFEKSVMKRIFPYYTWMRKNARLQVESVIDQPQKFALTEKVMNGIEGMNNKEDMTEDRFISDFARDWIQTPFSFGGKDKMDAEGNVTGTTPKQPLMLSPNLPFMDIGRIPDPTNPDDSLRELIAQMAPAIKVPIELATNKNMFFNSEIAKVGEDGKQENPITSRLAHVMAQLAPVNAINGGVDKEPGDIGLNALSVLGGIKMTSYDYEASKRQMIQEYNERMYNPTFGDRVKNGAIAFVDSVDERMREGVVKLAGVQPKSPGQYKGALSPISATTYESLSDAEKAKYTPPTEKDMTAYHKRAEELSKKAYEETGAVKKFIWATFGSDKDIPQERVVNVKKVIDGDTFTVDIDGEMQNIRLLLVDTPESAGQAKDNPMPFGKDASAYTKNMLLNRDVRIIFDKGDTSYGRINAYVEINDKDYNEQLLRQGLGQVRYLFGNTSPKVEQYYNAENEAFKAKRGIWSKDGYATPNDDTGYNWNE